VRLLLPPTPLPGTLPRVTLPQRGSVSQGLGSCRHRDLRLPEGAVLAAIRDVFIRAFGDPFKRIALAQDEIASACVGDWLERPFLKGLLQTYGGIVFPDFEGWQPIFTLENIDSTQYPGYEELLRQEERR